MKRIQPAAGKIKLISGILFFGLIIAFVPALTQETFDPGSVQPAECKNGRMKCGLQPPNREEMSSVEQSELNMIRHRGLPSSVDLTPRMPPVGDQGTQGSCVGWSTTYGIRSYQEQIERNWGYDAPSAGGQGEHVFSPAFTYNQINGGNDGGSNPVAALNLLVRVGSTPWKAMPYNVSDFRSQPSQAAIQQASKYRADSYQQLSFTTPDAIKAALAAGNPVMIGIKVYDNFYQLGNGVYDNFSGQFRGGHAIAVVGYDDSKTNRLGRGAFKLFNSWSPRWGNNGTGWIAYQFMPQANMAAFLIADRHDNPNPDQPTPAPDVNNEQIQQINAPSQVTASRGTYADKVEVSWSAVQGAVVYTVERAEPTDPDEFDAVGKSNGRTFTDTAIQKDVAYKYRVIAIGENAKSNPDASPVAEGYARNQAQNTPPAKVVGGAAVQGSSGEVVVTWSPAAAARNYEVIRWDGTRKRWQSLSNNVTAVSFTDRNPLADSVNYYRVRGTNPSGAGEWSDVASVESGGRQTPPGKVRGVIATQGMFRDKIEVRWTAVPSALRYYVFRYDMENEEMKGPFTVSESAYIDTEKAIGSGSQFAYVIIAGNAAGYGDYSDPGIGFTNPNVQRAGQVLNPPANLTAQIDEERKTITLSWTAVDKAAEYYVFRKKDGESDYRFVKNVPGKQTNYVEQIPGNPGELYMYTVRSKSELGGESANSNAVAGFINAQREVVRHRLPGDDGLDRFQGSWKAVYWDGESGPQDYILSVSAQGSSFNAQIKIGNTPPRAVTGSYVARSDYLETSGFRMQLVGEGKTGVVDISDRRILQSDLQIPFLKD